MFEGNYLADIDATEEDLDDETQLFDSDEASFKSLELEQVPG